MRLGARLVHLLLLLAFSAGGGGLPALDALLYHDANPADSPQGIHLEPPGSSCHTDTCLSALPSLPGTDAQSAPVPGRVAAGRPLPECLDGAALRAPTHRPGPGLPRSPPAA